jgi:cytochrome bd-type quinol oxidase subunit 2
MKHVGIGLLCGVAAYSLLAVIGYWLMMRFSSNTHDRQVEAATTSALILGPLGGVVAFIAGYIWSKNSF